MAANLVHMIESGVPVRFPRLRIAFTEAGISWVPWVMMRMDKEFIERRRDVPFLTEPPSHYVKQMWFATQPIEEPEHMRDVAALIDLFDGENQVVFASDWPHHDFDHPSKVLQIPVAEDVQAKIMGLERASPVRYGEARTVTSRARRAFVVARAADVLDGHHIVVEAAGRQFGVFNVRGRFYALPNTCFHQNGPSVSRQARWHARGRRGKRLAATLVPGRRGDRMSLAPPRVQRRHRSMPRVSSSEASGVRGTGRRWNARAAAQVSRFVAASRMRRARPRRVPSPDRSAFVDNRTAR